MIPSSFCTYELEFLYKKEFFFISYGDVSSLQYCLYRKDGMNA